MYSTKQKHQMATAKKLWTTWLLTRDYRRAVATAKVPLETQTDLRNSQ